jgi:uncharacterized protein
MEFVIPGIILGFASSQGRFCLNSGFADAAFKSDFRKVNILLTAILLQSVFVFLYAFWGAMPTLVPHNFLILAVGAFLFGMLMPMSGGCPGGILFKATEGQLPAIFSLAGFLLAMGVFYASPIHTPLEALHRWNPIADVHVQGFGIFVWATIALLLLIYILFFVKDAKPEGARWSWKQAGIAIGAAAILYSSLSVLRPEAAPLGFMPGFISAWQRKLSPEVWFVIAVFIGGTIAAIAKGGVSFQHAPLSVYVKRLAGGFGLGAAASLAAGCNVGYGLTFLPLLSLQAFIAMAAIFLGRVTAEKIKQRFT